MIKLTLHAAFTRTSPNFFEAHLMTWTGGYSRIEQLGFWKNTEGKATKEVSYQYIIFIEAKGCVKLQWLITNWFEAHTNEECIIFEIQTESTWNTDVVNIDRNAWRKAVDAILANPANLRSEPVLDLGSRHGFTGGSF